MELAPAAEPERARATPACTALLISEISTSAPNELLPDAVTVVVAELPEVPALAVIAGVVPLEVGTVEEGIAPLVAGNVVRIVPSTVDASVEAIVVGQQNLV